MTGELTATLDVAQIVLYAFWIFFAGLIAYLRREDRREGYPLESDLPRAVKAVGVVRMPKPKTFLLPHVGSASKPDYERDTREIKAERTGNFPGSPLQPTGDAMADGLGPAAYAMRADHPETTMSGEPLIVPMRAAKDFEIDGRPDPRGWTVIAGDGKVAGTVTDLWVDRADVFVRYLEVELAQTGAGRRLVPITASKLTASPAKVEVQDLFAPHFASVPMLKNPEQVTLLEEEKISAFFSGGRMYAHPKRLGPLL